MDKYKCIQIVLKEKFLGVGSKGFAGGDRLVATCILEKI